jgi:membrane protease YdiL (CAAX protease family)
MPQAKIKQKQKNKNRNNMIWKIILYVFITIVFSGLLAVFQQKINLNFEKIVLPQLAPTIGLIIMILAFNDLRFSINLDLNKFIVTKSLLALGIPFLLFIISFFVGKQFGLGVKLTDDLKNLIPLMFVGILIGSLGEEIGWRSFLQLTLEKKNTALLASIIVGTIWGLWHIGHYKNGALFMIGFLLFTISASIIIAWLLRDTKYNLIISVLFHVSINLGFLILFKNSLTDSKLMIINGIVWLIPAIGIVIATGKDLIKIQ